MRSSRAEYGDFRMDETENLTFAARERTRRAARGRREAIMTEMAGGRTAETVGVEEAVATRGRRIL